MKIAQNNIDFAKITKQICDAVAMIHQPFPPIVHCDIKEANIIIDKNDEVVKIADHKELLDEFIFPSTYKIEATKLFVYHTYLGQLNKEALQYCMDIVNIGQYPVVCLMNDYSLEIDKPSEEVISFVETHFDQYDVNK